MIKLKDLMPEAKVLNKTIKHVTSNGTLHIEIEEDPAGVIVDIIFNKEELVEVDIQFPAGNVEIKKKKSRVKLK